MKTFLLSLMTVISFSLNAAAQSPQEKLENLKSTYKARIDAVRSQRVITGINKSADRIAKQKIAKCAKESIADNPFEKIVVQFKELSKMDELNCLTDVFYRSILEKKNYELMYNDNRLAMLENYKEAIKLGLITDKSVYLSLDHYDEVIAIHENEVRYQSEAPALVDLLGLKRQNYVYQMRVSEGEAWVKSELAFYQKNLKSVIADEILYRTLYQISEKFVDQINSAEMNAFKSVK